MHERGFMFFSLSVQVGSCHMGTLTRGLWSMAPTLARLGIAGLIGGRGKLQYSTSFVSLPLNTSPLRACARRRLFFWRLRYRTVTYRGSFWTGRNSRSTTDTYDDLSPWYGTEWKWKSLLRHSLVNFFLSISYQSVTVKETSSCSFNLVTQILVWSWHAFNPCENTKVLQWWHSSHLLPSHGETLYWSQFHSTDQHTIKHNMVKQWLQNNS